MMSIILFPLSVGYTILLIVATIHAILAMEINNEKIALLILKTGLNKCLAIKINNAVIGCWLQYFCKIHMNYWKTGHSLDNQQN